MIDKISEIDLDISRLISKLIKEECDLERKDISKHISFLQEERVKTQTHPVFDRIRSKLIRKF